MKTLTFIIAAFLFSITCHAQSVNTPDSTIQNLKKYLSRNIRYLAVARENDVEGTVVLTVKINADKKLGDIEVVKHLTVEMDSEVVKKVTNYNKEIALPQGEYTIGFKFVMRKDSGEDKVEPIDTSKYKNYLFELDFIGYSAVRRTTIVN